MSVPLRVCFVALNAYPVIEPGVGGPIGGIETRSWMLARGLARQPETQVHFVVRHCADLRQREVEGVQLQLLLDRWYPDRESLALRWQQLPRFPWRRLHPFHLSDVWLAPLLAVNRLWKKRRSPLTPHPVYRNIDVDVYLTFGVQGNSATVIASAHAVGRPAVLFLGSDSDLDDRYFSNSEFVSTYHDAAPLCRWTIEHADRILCQTEAQQKKLLQWGKQATLLRNPFDFESWETAAAEPADEIPLASKRYVLWVGRAESLHKQPLLVNDLARMCPEVNFLMILNRRDEAVEAAVRSSAPANVHIVERVPFASMPRLMSGAAALVNTSSLEGFPNTFLQAAASGVPIVSLGVEAEFLQAAQAGSCAAGDLTALARDVRACWAGHPPGFHAEQARAYILQHHSLKSQAEQLATFLRDVVQGHASSALRGPPLTPGGQSF